MKKFLLLLFSYSLVVVSSPQSMAAEKGWRYWGYYQSASGSHTWSEAMTGPTVELHDGDVEGWVFTVSSKSIAPQSPHTSPSFKTLCKGVKYQKEKIRVGVIIDFGNASIAPKPEALPKTIRPCIVLPRGAIGLEVLKKVGTIRQSSQGFICGIRNYPAKECSAEIEISPNIKN